MTHVLIAEDHEENRNLLKMLLEANGYRVTAAADGQEALDAARRDPPDTIVSDVLMPKLDGFALCRAWTQDPGLKAIPFIFYSATNVRPEDEEFGLTLGAARYLTRPLEAKVFLAELRAVLQRRTERAVPASAPPVDDGVFHTLHGLALARKLEDKIAQLEAANRKLQESEASSRSLIESMLNGFAYCRMEYDDRDRPVDFVYLKVNDAFERLTGLKNVVGRKVSEVIPGIRELSPELFEIYGRVASTGIHKTFEFDFKSLAKWLTISVYSPGPGYFAAIFDDITERKRAEESLRESEQALRAIFDGALDGILVADVGTRKFLTANTAICSMLGYTHEEIVGISVSDIHPKQDLPHAIEQFEGQLGGKTPTASIVPMMRKDGSVFYAEIKAAPIRLGGKECLMGIFRDITERKAAEAKIKRLTQLYIALSRCNEAIVRCAGEEELFPQICRTAVQFGGMKMAWIGIVDPDTRMVQFVARFGEHADEYLRDAEISVDPDSPLGRGPTSAAIRENQPIWRQDFQHHALVVPWRERRLRFGFGASVSLPLRRNGVPIGVLTLYAAEAGSFDEAARHLLIEMATNISFALDNFAREAARVQAGNDLRAAEEQFRGLVEQSIAGTYIVQNGRFVYVNPRLVEIFGYDSADELIGCDATMVVAEADRGMVLENMRRRTEVEVESVNYAFTGVRKDGAMVDIGVHGARATHGGRPAVIGLLQDISEKKRAEEQIQRYLVQLQTAFMSTVEVATTLSEMRDPYTAGHERRVGRLAAAIGAELGFDAQRIEGLRVAGFLHDIGKITIPAEILSKPGKLNAIEFEMIKGHAQSSYDVLKNVEFPWPLAEVALQHHERMDGSGYPQGLKGDAILLEARIMAVADVIEAMSSHRPYRAGLGIEAALLEIERGRGSVYDAAVTDACLKLFRDDGFALPT